MERFNKIVKDYAERKTFKAIEKAEKEKHGVGCGCPNCAKHSVSEANSWIRWSAPEGSDYKDSEIYQTVVRGGKVKVEGGFQNDALLGQIQRRLKGGNDSL